MLETKGLYKIYKPKKGVPVTALQDVNIRFPDKGMVFLLGKSGSGKSTLLNVLGGLDRYDRGEIIIKGVSSRSFCQKHFDSYRNTYVGFIFQEYNILEEFTVGANIALALQLQGKKATDEKLNEILKAVDLDGYGARRPSELSGGQKQRVAIARALVKDPEIIMADEPTGALDSATGRQVLETLKRLSKDRLVLIVSHDREFAERYADRIIELEDGAVIRDVERRGGPLEETAEDLTFEADGITVRSGYQLTEEDRLAINAYLVGRATESVKIHRKIFNDNAEFQPTVQEKIPHRDGANFRLIKSKLPLKNAFRIGGSSLKHKKIRLVTTILLSCIAFGLFGLSDTFGAYNHVETCTNSMVDSDISYVSIRKQQKIGTEENTYWLDLYNALKQEELDTFREKTGVALTGVRDFDLSLAFEGQMGPDTQWDLYTARFTGFSVMNEEKLRVMDFPLTVGRLPEGAKNEIAISRYVADGFLKGGYRSPTAEKVEKIADYNALLGKPLALHDTVYTVVGIVDTRLDMDRYQSLAVEPEHMTAAEELIRFALEREFHYATQYSLAQVAMVSAETFTALETQSVPLKRFNRGNIWFYNEDISLDPYRIGKLSDFDTEKILWVDGPRTSLGDNEIIVTPDQIDRLGGGEVIEDPQRMIDLAKKCTGLQGQVWDQTESEELKGIKVVGVLNVRAPRMEEGLIMADRYYEKVVIQGDYDFAVGGTPESKGALRSMTAYCYEEKEGGFRYPLLNSVTYELDTVHEVLVTMAKVFLYIGLGFALFAALMLANFIATSISYKKQEIGILRAIGSRSLDVFRIFFSESFIIAMINFVLSSIGVGVATAVVNWILRQNGILISVLTFGLRQVVLLFAVSLAVAALASYFPVRRIAAKRPIDAIRNR